MVFPVGVDGVLGELSAVGEVAADADGETGFDAVGVAQRGQSGGVVRQTWLGPSHQPRCARPEGDWATQFGAGWSRGCSKARIAASGWSQSTTMDPSSAWGECST